MRWQNSKAFGAGSLVGSQPLFFENRQGFALGGTPYGWNPDAKGLTAVRVERPPVYPKSWRNDTTASVVVYLTPAGLPSCYLIVKPGQVVIQTDGQTPPYLATAQTTSGVDPMNVDPVALANAPAQTVAGKSGLAFYGIASIQSGMPASTANTVLRQRLVLLKVVTASSVQPAGVALTSYDPSLNLAIRSFQTAAGLPVTGVVDAQQWDMINTMVSAGKVFGTQAGGAPTALSNNGGSGAALPGATTQQAPSGQSSTGAPPDITGAGAGKTAPPPPPAVVADQWIKGYDNTVVGGAALLLLFGLYKSSPRSGGMPQ